MRSSTEKLFLKIIPKNSYMRNMFLFPKTKSCWIEVVNNTLRIKTGDINLIGKALNDFMMELKGYVFGRKFEGLGFYEFTYQ